MTLSPDMEAVVALEEITTDQLAAATLALAQANIPPDVQELLLFGDGQGTVAAGALKKALAAVVAQSSLPSGEGVREALAAMLNVRGGLEREIEHAGSLAPEHTQLQVNELTHGIDAIRKDLSTSVSAGSDGTAK